MKKIGFGFLMSLLVVITSCVDFVEPNVPYKTFDTALYLRTIQRSTDLNFFDLANSKMSLTLEAVDAEGGETLQSVEIKVRHRRLIPGVGLEYRPAGTESNVNDVLIKTLSLSDFQKASENPNHPTQTYMRTSFEITATEMMSAVGITPAQLQGGDSFEVRLYVTDKFGRTFDWTNRSADVAGGFFYASPFLYLSNVICPTDLGGTYRYQSSEMQSVYGACAGTIEGTVTLTPVANSTAYTVSDATFGFWPCYGDSFGGNVRLNDACGILSFTGADKYGDSYTFNFISNNGSELVFTWVNGSNETGRVVLFANEGKPWPSTLR